MDVLPESPCQGTKWRGVTGIMDELAERLERAKSAWEDAHLNDGRDAYEAFMALLDDSWPAIMFALRATRALRQQRAS